jgi:hypothetical protein
MPEPPPDVLLQKALYEFRRKVCHVLTYHQLMLLTYFLLVF